MNAVPHLPWGAWYDEGEFRLEMPEGWNISYCAITDAPGLSETEIESALSQPIGCEPLEKLAQGKSRVAIAIEDITRPSILEGVLNAVLRRLLRAGVSKENIFFIICNGAHAPMLREDVERKLGKAIASEYWVLNHNPYDNLVDTGILLGKTPFQVNRDFYHADFKITIGSIMPHHFAGFSAGGKLVLPGLSDIATLERSHKFVMMGLRGGVNEVKNNKFRLELENVVQQVGVDFFVGVVPNAKRMPAGLFAGDLVKAHRKGVDFGREIYNTPVPRDADVLILNAYPKDSELLQADTAFTPLKSIKEPIVKKDGLIILTSCCSNGLGHHSLFGPGMRLYKPPVQRRFLKENALIFFSQNVNPAEYRKIFHESYPFKTNWGDVLNMIKSRFGEQCNVTILPHAPLQLLS